VVEDKVKIGMNATILPGVILAEGCVIGAGSVVTKSTEPNAVYVGNPATKIKLRF
jgi:acetyltransferase-like isoleucine patch superfamily enzyme